MTGGVIAGLAFGYGSTFGHCGLRPFVIAGSDPQSHIRRDPESGKRLRADVDWDYIYERYGKKLQATDKKKQQPFDYCLENLPFVAGVGHDPTTSGL